jgi:hypothetical protein
MQRLLRAVCGQRALAQRDGALGEGAQFLGFRQRRNQTLLDYQRGAKIAQHRQPVLRRAPQFSMSHFMSHIKPQKRK